MKMITAESCRKAGACYTDKELKALFDRPMTIVEVFTRDDGPWATVSAQDRAWAVKYSKGALSPRLFRKWAAACARKALFLAAERGHVLDGTFYQAAAEATAAAYEKTTASRLDTTFQELSRLFYNLSHPKRTSLKGFAMRTALFSAHPTARSAAIESTWSLARLYGMAQRKPIVFAPVNGLLLEILLNDPEYSPKVRKLPKSRSASPKTAKSR
jgi:hypothetical protein